MACVHTNLITMSERHTGSAPQEVKLHRKQNNKKKKAKSVASDRCSAAATCTQTATRGGRDKRARQTKRKNRQTSGDECEDSADVGVSLAEASLTALTPLKSLLSP